MRSSFSNILICALAFSLAACGGSGGGGSSNPPSSNPPPTNPTPPPSNEDPGDPTPPEEPEEPEDPAGEFPDDLPPEFRDPAGPYAPQTAPRVPTDREAIEKIIGVSLLINQAATTLYPIHDEIGPEVAARGHLNWGDETQLYTLPLLSGGNVRVEFWSDLGAEGYDKADFFAFTANEAGLGRVSGPTEVQGVGESNEVREYYMLHTMEQWGIYVGDTKQYRLDGSLFIEPYAGDGYHLMHGVDYDFFENTTLIVKESTSKGIVDYIVYFDLYTKKDDPGVIEGVIEWERQRDGVYQYMQTFSPVKIAEVAGHLQMISGSFHYVHEGGDNQRVLRVSVAADPAFLKVEVDEDWDGEFDTESNIAQSEVNLLLP